MPNKYSEEDLLYLSMSFKIFDAYRLHKLCVQ